MHPSLRSALVTTFTFASAAVAGAQTQAGQSAPAAAAPAVGESAPDFMAMATDSTGKTSHVMLSSLRGKVVVLAFYPLDRSSGCTAELNKFRDEYKTLFGDGVVVYPTSVDSLGSHASWAKEAHFPFAMIADTKSELAKMYASDGGARPYFKRTVFVIGKDGKVAYADTKFGALSADAYDKLAAAIKLAKAN
ncbi:MAG: alkyl hydroperoxide reductase/Thiol specific antioxidant/Mal allergen [Gemmatimonadetes bacterium]|nr:alkyl hydroperoxide reductase/Thiol specific antioxidant/Mal allergen [Gemmatimonadota bacterium]